MKICIIEDDPMFNRLLGTWAKLANYEFQQFQSGGAALAGINDDVDCVLIDWHLGAQCAETIVVELRQKLGWDFAIIVVTGSDLEELVVRALQAGADDFIMKPIQMAELIARIQACTRRSTRTVPSVQRGPYTLNLNGRQLLLNGEELQVTPKEFELARLLFQHPNRPLARAFIQQRVWGSVRSNRTLDTHVCNLKTKLRMAETAVDIVAVPKYGYKLVI